jgi:hypothetical protein
LEQIKEIDLILFARESPSEEQNPQVVSKQLISIPGFLEPPLFSSLSLIGVCDRVISYLRLQTVQQGLRCDRVSRGGSFWIVNLL